ncbi:MAG: 1-(5-phosphoribosyl)-5-[(5-phosphoribosylamino)methylideneamino]imidazole-4-carboxamide isomerase [Syntrophobacteraceae bacterium]
MIIFPAIDLKDGVCVRLRQGDPERATVYGTDPLAMAAHWADQGAQWLHLVDLDGAFSKEPVNHEIVLKIARSLSIPVEVGGGIRNLESIDRYICGGAARVIIGTAALREPKMLEEACRLYPGKIALGLDARQGLVAVEGWKESTRTDAVDLVMRFKDLELAAVIYTDIHRDGMQTGVNIEATRRLMEMTGMPVIASGGVSNLGDIEALLGLSSSGLLGVITGRAIYEGTLDLREAIALARTAGAGGVER